MYVARTSSPSPCRYATSGSSLADLLQNVRAQEKVPALDDMITAVPKIAGEVVDAVGVDIEGAREVEGVVYIYTGVGVSAGAWLGWLDTNGYRMVGAQGAVAAALRMGMTVRAGLDAPRTSVRVVCFMANVGFDVLVRLQEAAAEEGQPFSEEQARRSGAHPAPRRPPERPSLIRQVQQLLDESSSRIQAEAASDEEAQAPRANRPRAPSEPTQNPSARAPPSASRKRAHTPLPLPRPPPPPPPPPQQQQQHAERTSPLVRRCWRSWAASWRTRTGRSRGASCRRCCASRPLPPSLPPPPAPRRRRRRRRSRRRSRRALRATP